MRVKFNFEGGDEACAFFALYAGLRMYKEQRDRRPKKTGTFSVASAEAYCMLKELEQKFPKHFKAAKEEYDEVYGSREQLMSKN